MIPFPKLHIAQSVLNRIMNTLEDAGPLMPPVAMPAPPDPTLAGAAIDEQISAPPQPIAAPPENVDAANNEMLSASLTGGSPFGGALVGSIGVVE